MDKINVLNCYYFKSVDGVKVKQIDAVKDGSVDSYYTKILIFS